MNLLVNGLSARLGGGQTYLYQLLRHLPKEWSITLLSSGGLQDVPAHIQQVIMPELANPFRRAWWERTKLEAFAIAHGCELIFNPACLLPRIRSKTIKTAVTFQNMLPFDDAQQRCYPIFSYRRLRDFLLARGLVSAMRRADLVIFISAFARDFMTQQKQVKPKQQVMIPHAVDAMFFNATERSTDFPWSGAPYFLYVSFLDFYKCQREMVQAYAALKTQHGVTTKLVLAGTGYARYVDLVKQDIVALGLENNVVLLGNVPHAVLPALYQHAAINVFASTCENCPNILMELMASRVPALVSNHGPMPEIAGDTVTYFDPRNHEDFVTKWVGILANIDAAKANAARAAEKARTYRWEETIAQTAQAFEATVRGT